MLSLRPEKQAHNLVAPIILTMNKYLQSVARFAVNLMAAIAGANIRRYLRELQRVMDGYADAIIGR